MKICKSYSFFQGETTLHLGCKIHKGQLNYNREDVDILELLLEHGGSESVLKLAGDLKEIPMHNVAFTGNVDIISTLFNKLDRGKIQVWLIIIKFSRFLMQHSRLGQFLMKFQVPETKAT